VSKLDMHAGILPYTRAAQLEQSGAYTADEEPILRTAYSRLTLAHSMSFECAMRTPALAIAIRNTAHALRQTPGQLFNEPETK
jgi:hypothetical protein